MAVRTRTIRARELRRDGTDAERILWRALREAGLRFRRQHPIGSRITDFACPARKLIIELDGSQHMLRRNEDQRRTEELAQRGYRVIRFWNGEVTSNLDGVLERIRQELKKRPTSPRPSPP